MKYNIFRTTDKMPSLEEESFRTTDKLSFLEEEPKPCNNAFRVKDDNVTNHFHWEIEINSLEELNKLQEEVDESLIIHKHSINDGYQSRSIEIYDGYVI